MTGEGAWARRVPERPPPAYPIESVDNALLLLSELARRRQLRIKEVAELLGVARSTAHRLLAVLAALAGRSRARRAGVPGRPVGRLVPRATSDDYREEPGVSFSLLPARRARPAMAGAPGLAWRLAGGGWGPGSGQGPAARRRMHYPLPSDLERRARRRIPGFAYDFLAGGTGDDLSVARNRAALDAIEIAARYGQQPPSVTAETTLFGVTYTAPIGISPTGNDGVVWPGASRPLAATAAEAGIPYILGTLASASIEEIAPLCPGQLWFQVYGFPRDDHRVTFDLIARARSAGVSVLVLGVDAPVRAARPRDQRNGLTVPFRPTARTAAQVCRSPAWAVAALRTRVPVFANITRYVPAARGIGPIASFVQQELRGSFSWSEIRRIRDVWPGALVVKGVGHPGDARLALAAGADGVVASNHGGRQSDAAPAAVDVLPCIADAVRGRATVLFDGGIRSGLDVARVLALGADAAFSGRGFLTALAAIGDTGSDHLATQLIDELRTALAQHGAADVAGLRALDVRHPTRWDLPVDQHDRARLDAAPKNS